MKKVIAGIILLISVQVTWAQNEYKTEIKNSPDTQIDINVGTNDIHIIGHDKDEIIITTNFSGEYVDEPSKKKMEAPERAAGLKPISVSASDNTGIGLVVDKQEDYFAVLKISKNAQKMSYKFMVPNKVSLNIHDMHAEINTTYFVENLHGEIVIHALNSDVKMNKISGPVVANATNGNVEIKFSKLTPEHPNSILSVNGFVDVTLPKETAADLQLHSVNGEAYTDWEIDVDDEASAAVPVIANMNMFNIEGTINGGGIPISIQSVNGDIFLRKRK